MHGECAAVYRLALARIAPCWHNPSPSAYCFCSAIYLYPPPTHQTTTTTTTTTAAAALCVHSGYFANFATEFSGRVAIAEAGALEALVALLVATVPDPADAKAAAPIPDLLRNLLRATLLLCDEYDARAALGAGETGGIETLLVVLDSEYSELQSLALSCLMAACRNNRNRMIVRVSGGLVKLLQFIGNPKFAASHSQALQVLAELLGDSSAMAAVSERGPVDKQNPTGTPAPVTALVSFVSAADNGTRVNALNCVCNAAKNAANRRILMDLKVEKAVAERLWYDDFDINLTHISSLASTNAVTTVPPRVVYMALLDDSC